MKVIFTGFAKLIEAAKRSKGPFEMFLFAVVAVLALIFLFSFAPILTIAAVNVFLKVFGVTTIPITVPTVLATFWLLLVSSSSSSSSNEDKMS